MASYSGFVRKAPTERLKSFLGARGIGAPEDFEWSSQGRLGDFVRSIDALLSELPDRQQDTTKADLDLLASIADDNGLIATERICGGLGIDLERIEGVQDALLMLATDYPDVIDRIAAEASMMRRTGGRDWSTFQFDDDGKPWALESPEAREKFLEDALKILKLPQHRKREADWYRSVRVHPITGEEIDIVQATIYVEARAESELAFGASNTLERKLVQKVLEVGVACDAKAKIVEICAKGGKKIRDEYVASFKVVDRPLRVFPLFDLCRQHPTYSSAERPKRRPS